LEPINDCAVDQGGELSGPSSQRLTDWTETQSHVQVLFDFIQEKVPAVISCVWFSLGFNLVSDTVDDDFLFVTCVQFGNLTGGQKIVDVNQKSLLSDLPLGKQEQDSLLFDSCFLVEDLEVVFQVVHSVSGRNGDLEGRERHDEGGQFGEGLFS
jgi:hypothetical protein